MVCMHRLCLAQTLRICYWLWSACIQQVHIICCALVWYLAGHQMYHTGSSFNYIAIAQGTKLLKIGAGTVTDNKDCEINILMADQ